MPKLMCNSFQQLLCLGLLALVAHAAPTINSATVNYRHNVLIISGSFSSTPLGVTLGGVALTVQGANGSSIIAGFPSTAPASGFAPGSYLLRVVLSNGNSLLFDVAMGASESSVDTLKQQVASLQAAVSQLQAALSAVQSNSVLALNGKLNLEPDGTTVQFSGVQRPDREWDGQHCHRQRDRQPHRRL